MNHLAANAKGARLVQETYECASTGGMLILFLRQTLCYIYRTFFVLIF